MIKQKRVTRPVWRELGSQSNKESLLIQWKAMDKFCSGQTTFHKLDAEGLAREMWRAHGANAARFLSVRISHHHTGYLNSYLNRSQIIIMGHRNSLS